MRKLFVVIAGVLSNPINRHHRVWALWRFFRWQIGSWLVPGKVLLPWVNGSRIFAGFMMSGSAGCAYSGLHEFEEMSFCLHALRTSDLFMDVGANVGVFTVLAGAGVKCDCTAIEPGAEPFSHLTDNVIINQMRDRTRLINACVGAADSRCRFVDSEESTLSHIAPTANDVGAREINVMKIDSALNGRIPTIIKIDVEGFEKQALTGATHTLASEDLKAILIELGTHSLRYGVSADEIHHFIQGYGFKPYSYDPFRRKLTALTSFSDSENTLYIRDFDFICNRLQNAERFNVFGVNM